jgi:acid phosphatase family membrane protein YuiD
MINDLIHNTSLVAPFIAWLLAQGIKPLISLIGGEGFDIKRSLSTGGMPSSHTSTVIALTTNLAIRYGVGSYQFAMSLVFSSIVIYDAMGIRHEAGVQAEMLNSWSKTLGELFEGQFTQANLKTMLGHTISQVVFGILLGLIIGFSITYSIGF